MKALVRPLAAWFVELSPFTVTLAGFGLVLSLVAADYFAPREMSFTLLYLMVVVLVGWGAGKWPAIWTSSLVIVTTLAAHWFSPRATPAAGWIVLWNYSARFAVFCLMGSLAARLAHLNRSLSCRVAEQTAQLTKECEDHQITSARLGDALERFEQVINNITEVFWLTDVSKREVAYISPGYERVWGRRCADLYRDPQSWTQAVHPEDRELVQRRSATEQAQGGYDVEYRILRPDGAERWIRDRAFPVRNAQGKVCRIAGIAEDITEWKRTRELLRTQAAIVEHMAEGVIVTDEQGVVVQINPAGERIWGYPREEVLGKTPIMFSGLPEPEARTLLRQVLDELKATGSWRGTFKNRRKDGSIGFCEAVINRLEIQGRTLMVAVEQDVTERVRTQQQIQMQARVLESMAESVLVTDEQGTIVLVNSGAETLLGYERAELLGKPLLQLAALSEEEFHREFRQHLGEIQAHGYSAGEYLARRKDGRVIEVSIRNSQVVIGERRLLVVVGQDVTERKRTERALRQSEATLRVILDAAPAPAFLADPQGTLLATNEALCRNLGLPASEIAGKSIFDFLPPEVAARRKEVFDEAVRRRETVQVEDTRAGKHFISFYSPILDPAGNVTGVAVLALDITQRKRAELMKEAFLFLGARLSAASGPVEAARAVYAAADLLWKWDAASFDLYSPGSGRVQNVLNCDVLNGHRTEVPASPPENAPSSRMRRILELGPELILRGDAPVPQPSDSIRFGDRSRASASKMCVPIRRDGQAVGVVSIQSYISNAFTPDDLKTLQALADHCSGALERIRAQQELQQREGLNRTILATAMDGFFALDFTQDPGGAILDANEAYSRMSGYSREELLRMRIADVEALETLEDTKRHKDKIMATGADRFETRHRRKDGRIIDVEISVSRLLGEGERVFGFARDITERKRSDRMREALLALGTKLSAATTPAEAARAVFSAADQLWKWDAALLDSYVQELDRMEPVLFCDLVDGHRQEVPAPDYGGPPPERFRRILRQRGELILRQPDQTKDPDFVRFGDTSRLSASLMCVPLRRDGQPVGILSIQSYTPNAYTEEDLRTLQALADHCAGALERIRAETALRDSQEQMRAFYDSPGGLRGIVEMREEDLCIVSANAPLALAYGRTVAGMQGVQTKALGVPPALLDLWRDKLAESRRVNGPLTFEHSIAHRVPGGWALATVCPLQTKEGAPPRFAFLATDITDRKQAEQSLAEALEFNRHVVSASTVGIAVYRASGECVLVNEALARITGGTVEQLLSQDFRRLPAWRESGMLAMAQMALATRQPQEIGCETESSFGRKVSISTHFSCFVTQGEVHLLLMITDETERKRAERQLAEALELNQKMLAISTVGIAAYKAGGQCVFANEALARMVGGSMEQMLQNDFRRSTVWQESGKLQMAEQVLQDGRARSSEFFGTSRFGRTLWQDCHLAAFTSGGQPHLLEIVSEITERKGAEEALKLQSLVLQNMAEGVVLINPDQTIVFANPALETMFGYLPGELVGKNVSVLNAWSIEETERFNAEVARAAQERGVWCGEYRNRRKDGSLFTSEARVSVLELGGRRHFVCVQQDITERKFAEEALRQSENRVRAIITRAPVLLFAVDCDGILRFEDGQALQALGVTPGVNVGHAVTEVYAHLPGLVENARRALRGEQFEAIVEAGAVTLDCWYVPTRDAEGTPAGYIGVATDITVRHRLERQILEISDREQARIGQDIHDGLCQHLVSLAFDANSLHSALAGKRRPESKKTRRIADSLDQAITEARQLARGLFPVRLETEGLAPALEELAKTTSARFPVHCTFGSQGLAAVENAAIATHLYRIAQEAVTNAVRHSQARSISIRLKARARDLVLSVKDNGIGLPALGDGRSKGMGLHIMDYRARSIGAALQLGSGPGGGTIVSCCIPRRLS